MKTKVRNHLSTLCLRYVEDKDPASYKLLVRLAEENYKTGRPMLNNGSVYRNFLRIKADEAIVEVL